MEIYKTQQTTNKRYLLHIRSLQNMKVIALIVMYYTFVQK